MNIHIPVVVKQIAWVRHEGIRREELAQFGVVVAGVEVLQAGAVLLLASETLVGDTNVAIAGTTIGIIALIADNDATLIGG